MNGPGVREATPADLPALVALMTEFYAEAALALPAAAAARAFEPLLADARLGRVWIMEVDSRPAGYVVLTLGYGMEYGGMRGFVDDLFVRPDHRGRGLAALIGALILLALACHWSLPRIVRAGRKLVPR